MYLTNPKEAEKTKISLPRERDSLPTKSVILQFYGASVPEKGVEHHISLKSLKQGQGKKALRLPYVIPGTHPRREQHRCR